MTTPTKPETMTIVRCPRCGSLEAGSVEPIGIEFDRMLCAWCGHEEICDVWQLAEWNETVPVTRVRRDVLTVLPDERFLPLWRALGGGGGGVDALERLRDAYDEPHRAYHTARHVGACLALLDDPEVAALAERPFEVEAALWFHDVVYDTRADDNEEKSAAWAESTLRSGGVAPEVAGRVAEHVRATKAHGATTPDGMLVVDVDLAILGADAETFARYEAEIRREYGWVDEAAFSAGRRDVLRRLLERPAIYATNVFVRRYEQRARDNLTRALRAIVS